ESAGPSHDSLLDVPDSCQLRVRAQEGGSHELILVPGGVLELVQKHVAVGLAQSASGVRVVLQDLECEWNEVIERDLHAVNASASIDAIVGLQLVLTS